jgi:cytochrome c oxidase subunit 2
MSRIRRADRATRRAPTRRRAVLLTPTAALLAIAGCDAPLSIFSRASDSARSVSYITWFMIILSAVVFTGVMALYVVAMRRNRDRNPADVDLSERGVGWIVWGGAVMPGFVLLVLFVLGMAAMGRYPEPPPVVTIHVTGHQWWWDVEYEFPNMSEHFRTANEIHVPVGRPSRLVLTTADVIHSFWVPQLQGKLDLIPGDTNDLRLLPRRTGVFAGTCAEFCGQQHAHMGIRVIVDDTTTFKQWAAQQLADAQPPGDPSAAEGEQLFVGGPCAMCHTVRGTSANGQVAPDLTHVGSRLTIAAGTLPNTLGNLEGWIANAQAIKPGAKMPTLSAYTGPQLRAVAAYVASLK